MAILVDPKWWVLSSVLCVFEMLIEPLPYGAPGLTDVKRLTPRA